MLCINLKKSWKTVNYEYYDNAGKKLKYYCSSFSSSCVKYNHQTMECLTMKTTQEIYEQI